MHPPFDKNTYISIVAISEDHPLEGGTKSAKCQQSIIAHLKLNNFLKKVYTLS